MDKPPTKAKPSAEDAEAQDRSVRLRKLADEHREAYQANQDPDDMHLWVLLRDLAESKTFRQKVFSFRDQMIRKQLGREAGLNGPLPVTFQKTLYCHSVQILVRSFHDNPIAIARHLVLELPDWLGSRKGVAAPPPGVDDPETVLRVANAITPHLDDVDPGAPFAPRSVAVAVVRAALKELGDTRPDNVLR